MTALSAGELSSMPVFHGLSPSELARMAGYLHVRDVPDRTLIFAVDQPGEVIYMIRSGTVKVHVEQADGSDAILAILGPGEILGEISLIDRLGRSANAVTMERTSLAWMDYATFIDCLQIFSAMAHNVVGILSRRLRLANAQIESLTTEKISGRVARQLLALAHEYGEPSVDGDGAVRIPLRLTQVDFAGLIGATRASVNGVLRAFGKKAYISVDHDRRITVLDHEALALECD
jgi:CRP/FNR family cyclic AMP-dependent transcriptional regulator